MSPPTSAGAVAFEPRERALHASRGNVTEVWTADGLVARGKGGAVHVLAPRPGTTDVMLGLENAAALLYRRGGETALRFKGTTGVIKSIAFHPAGDRVALGRCIFEMTGKMTSKNAVEQIVATFPDGERLLTAGGALDIVDWNGQRVTDVRIPDRSMTEFIAAIATSPDGATFGCAVRKRGLLVWDHPTAVLRPLAEDTEISVLTFAPDGSRVASAGGDGVARVHDVKTGQLVGGTGCFAAGVGARLAFVTPSVLALPAAGGELRLWNVDDDSWLALWSVSAKEWLAVDSDGRFAGSAKLAEKLTPTGVAPGTRVGPLTEGLLARWL